MKHSQRPTTRPRHLIAFTLGVATLVAAALFRGSVAFAGGDGFVDELQLYDKALWFKSDGWANGWKRNDTGWRAKNAELRDGRLHISLTDEPSAGRGHTSGEYQTRRVFGYGRFEARLKAAAAPGLVTGFFTYSGPSMDGAPHHEIDFEFLGKAPQRVQVNYFTDGVGGHETMIDLGFDASEDFHTYAFEWRPDSIRWFVDGRLVHEESGARGPLPSVPGKIYLHLWAGKGLRGWLGRFAYPGHPLTAEVDCVAYLPLEEIDSGKGCES
jgi:beta-glucanase (GH16 family)